MNLKMDAAVGVEEKFFQLLQIAVGKQAKKIELTDEEWKAIYEIACKQSLVVVVFTSADVLSCLGIIPPMDLLYWHWRWRKCDGYLQNKRGILIRFL